MELFILDNFCIFYKIYVVFVWLLFLPNTNPLKKLIRTCGEVFYRSLSDIENSFPVRGRHIRNWTIVQWDFHTTSATICKKSATSWHILCAEFNISGRDNFHQRVCTWSRFRFSSFYTLPSAGGGWGRFGPELDPLSYQFPVSRFFQHFLRL